MNTQTYNMGSCDFATVTSGANLERIPLNSSKQIQKPTLRSLAASLSTILAVAALAPPTPTASAQTSGTVPATCTINSDNTLTCSVKLNLSGVTGTFSGNALTLAAGSTPPPAPTPPPPPAPAPSAVPNCTAITPGSQNAVQSGSLSQLSANCTGATSYQWYTGASFASRTPISGETTASYTPSSGAVGTTTYWVSATNSIGTTDNPASATITISAPVVSSVCPAGEPRVSTNFSTYATNFTYQPIYGNSVFVLKLTLAAGDSTVGKTILPTFLITQDDTTTFSDNRTISVSQQCNDFSSNARIVFSGRSGGSTAFVTTGDSRASANIATLSPGVWYINVRNDSCPGSENCSISGIWRNWNR